jgi:carbon monoxide dehydrogenase subunit G
MASIRKEIPINARATEVWAALRDVGRVDRLFPGVLTGSRLEGDVRVVAFASGLVVREQIVAVDDAERRVAYAVVGGPPTHHNASMQVLAEGEASRVVWISDFLSDGLTATIGPLVEEGARALKRHFEAT